jgi:hypothetical protein
MRTEGVLSNHLNFLLRSTLALALAFAPSVSLAGAASDDDDASSFGAWASHIDGAVFSAAAEASEPSYVGETAYEEPVYSSEPLYPDEIAYSAGSQDAYRAPRSDWSYAFSAWAEEEPLYTADADEAPAETAPEREAAQRLMRRRVGENQQDAGPAEPVFPAPVALGSNDDAIAIPDRWRLVEALDVKKENVLDPYNQNTLKADRPIFGRDWFLNVLLISDSLTELRRIPTPVGGQLENGAGRIDQFGDPEQVTFNQNFITSFSLIKGNTVFRPPDWEFRFTGVTNLNYNLAKQAGVLRADPSDDSRRRFDQHFALQELFIDKHLWNKSDRYDFDSLRIGIQPFISDFRGFLFQDQQPGVRLFGNFINNRIQYNLAWFRRLNKDTNSGLNETELRSDDVFIANMYYQDFPALGFQLQGTLIYNKNREGDRTTKFNENNFIAIPAGFGNLQPRNYDVFYVGFNGDGHFDRLNLTFSFYNALGRDERNQIADRSQDIQAYFGALETSVDFDWYRLKAFALYASGDPEPFDGKSEGFDAIFENPQFAGFDSSYFQRQAIPLVQGGGVVLSGRNGFIPSLRSSKEEGQSNFVNPGIRMVGVGADFDILPELRVFFNASYLDFDQTASLAALRNQPRVRRHIGEDYSMGIIYRPLFINNVMFRLNLAALVPGEGFDDLFDDNNDNFLYSALANVILTY